MLKVTPHPFQKITTIDNSNSIIHANIAIKTMRKISSHPFPIKVVGDGDDFDDLSCVFAMLFSDTLYISLDKLTGNVVPSRTKTTEGKFPLPKIDFHLPLSGLSVITPLLTKLTGILFNFAQA